MTFHPPNGPSEDGFLDHEAHQGSWAPVEDVLPHHARFQALGDYVVIEEGALHPKDGLCVLLRL
jgi:hypothetical protein